MTCVGFALGSRRAFEAGALAFCLLVSNAMSTGICAQGGCTSMSSLKTNAAKGIAGPDSAPNSGANQSSAHHLTKARINDGYGKLPMTFEANAGQANSDVRFIARDSHRSVLLTSDGAVITLTKAPGYRASKFEKATGQFLQLNPSAKIGNLKSSTVHFKFVAASASPTISGVDQLPGKINFLRGNDPEQWRTNVATYARVKYENMYPGVDLIYYGGEQQLEYDLILAPGATPKAIAFDVKGAASLSIDRNGALVAHTPAGDLRHEKPLIYQETNGVRHRIQGRYAMKGKRRVGFKVGDYDASKPLVIDPTLKYSFKFGGSANDQVTGIAVDSQGNAYMMGQTFSSDFPTKNPINGTLRGQTDTFVMKLNADGNAIVYSTYLGGSQSEFSGGIAVDSSGNAYVTGQTFSTDFPVTTGAFQTRLGGGFDAFVAKLNPDGNRLVYSTLLGSSQSGDGGTGIAVDSTGSAYVTGVTGSGFPTMNPFQPTPGFSSFGVNAFVTKLNPTGSGLVYSSYLGGSGGAGGSSNGDRGSAIAVDGSGNAYVTGSTASTNFPTTAGAFQTAHGGAVFDAFVTKISAAGGLSYSTYLGGNGNDVGAGIAVDSSGNAYVTGGTASTNFPTTPNALQTTLHGSLDAFVTKLVLPGSALSVSAVVPSDTPQLGYSTHLGGNGATAGNGIAVDGGANAYVTGTTGAPDLPAKDPLFACNETPHAFVAKFESEALAFGSCFVVDTQSNGAGIAVDPLRNIYVGINRDSADGTSHAEVDKLAVGPDCSVTLDNRERSFDALGKSVAILTGHSNCKPTATSGASWLRIREVGFVPENGVCAVDYSVEPNPSSEPRTTTIRFGDQTFTVHQASSMLFPSCTLSPNSIPSGGPGFTLRVNGTGFGGNSILGWNGENRLTTLVNTTQLTAAISAADISIPGSARVTVFDVSPGGGTSPPVNFTINQGPDFLIGFDQSTVTAQAGTKARVTVNINRLGGFNGNVTITPPDPANGIKPKPPGAVTTSDSSATFKLKIGGGVAPGRYDRVFTANDDSGRTRTATATLIVQ
jgi:hypothetical protein